MTSNDAMPNFCIGYLLLSKNPASQFTRHPHGTI